MWLEAEADEDSEAEDQETRHAQACCASCGGGKLVCGESAGVAEQIQLVLVSTCEERTPFGLGR